MKKMRATALLLLTSSMLLVGCGEEPTTVDPTTVDPTTVEPTTQDPTTKEPTTSTGGKTSSDPVTSSEDPTESTSDAIANYDAWIDTWSEKDHLYIHYLRKECKTFADYSKYGLWLWEPGKAGALFAGANAPEGITASTDSWMTDIGGSGNSIDQAGVCADIDLKSQDYISGQYRVPVSFDGVEKIGYLVVEIDSMKPGNFGWVKDGTDNYITDVSASKRSNGSLHVFLVAKSTEEYRLYYNESVYVNPVTADTTGAYRSKTNISSSFTPDYDVSTSEKFYRTGGVGYQLFIPTFRDSDGDHYGDLRGVIDSLQYLKDLSVDTIWLSPFLECNSYHGYDTIDYYKVDPKFGTMDDFNELLYKAHQMGIKIIMDLVLNHASTQSSLFKKAHRGETGIDKDGNEFSYRDFFHFKFKGDTTTGTTKVENDMDWIRDGESNYYYYAKFSDDMPEFNYDYQGTRDYVLDVAKYYLGKGVDGFRLDAIKHIYMANESKNAVTDDIIEDISDRTYYDEEQRATVTETRDFSTNSTKNIKFWRYFASELKKVYPDCFLTGENLDGWDERIAPVFGAMDSQLDFNMYYHTLEWLYCNFGHSASALSVDTANKLGMYKRYRSKLINTPFTSNHDVSRAINHINSTKASEFNDPEVDVKISGTELQYNKAKMHAAITMLTPGLSFIYYGDELGMSSNTKENNLGQDNNLDRFYRQPFKWKDESLRPFFSFGSQYTNAYDAHNAKMKSMEDQLDDPKSVLNFYKGICAVKGSDTFPKNGDFAGYSYDDNNDIFYFVVNANGNGTKTHRIMIHTGGAGGNSSAVDFTIGATEKIVYKYNATDTRISPFGVVVISEK